MAKNHFCQNWQIYPDPRPGSPLKANDKLILMTLNRVHVKIYPKASVLNMNCYYVTVVECLKVARTRKIKHDRCS